MIRARWRQAVPPLLLLVPLAPGPLGPRPLGAQEPDLRPRRLGSAVLLVGATVIDGRGGPPRPNEAVLVMGDEIFAMGDESNMGQVVPEATRVLEVHGAYLVPGYIDAYAQVRDTAVLESLLAAGVTSVMNPGPSATDEVDYQRAVRSRDIAGPRIYAARRVIDGPGGDSPDAEIADTPDEARQAVRAQVEDADFVQLSRHLGPDLVLAAIREAHATDAIVAGDLEATSWTWAARAGIDILSHLVSANEEILPEGSRPAFREAVAAGADPYATWLELVEPDGPEIDAMIGALLTRDTPVAPVLAGMESRLRCADPAYAEETASLREAEAAGATVRRSWGSCPSESWSSEERERVRSAWVKALRIVRLLYDQDVRLLAGSDAPRGVLGPGASFHRELELLVEAGIPEVEVIAIATRNAAIALEILHEVGTLEQGKRADLVVLRSNPLVDIRNLRDIDAVMKDGRFYLPDERRREGS